jgi:hypothetical protein
MCLDFGVVTLKVYLIKVSKRISQIYDLYLTFFIIGVLWRDIEGTKIDDTVPYLGIVSSI